MMTYKGYSAQVEYYDEAGLFQGEVCGTRDVITFQGESMSELRKAFRESVDDYLAFCEERGEEPDKPFSGNFVVRVSPELHRKIYQSASKEGISVNAWMSHKLEEETAEYDATKKKSTDNS